MGVGFCIFFCAAVWILLYFVLYYIVLPPSVETLLSVLDIVYFKPLSALHLYTSRCRRWYLLFFVFNKSTAIGRDSAFLFLLFRSRCRRCFCTWCRCRRWYFLFPYIFPYIMWYFIPPSVFVLSFFSVKRFCSCPTLVGRAPFSPHGVLLFSIFSFPLIDVRVTLGSGSQILGVYVSVNSIIWVDFYFRSIDVRAVFERGSFLSSRVRR